jgi:hypothetical protein
MVGMVGTRLDHVKVGAGDTAAQRRQVAQSLAQALQARAVELVAQPAQQQAVADHQRAAAEHVEEAPPAGGIDRAARFQRQRDVGAVVAGDTQPEQTLHARQQGGIGAQVGARQQQRAGRGRFGNGCNGRRQIADQFAAQVQDHAAQRDVLGADRIAGAAQHAGIEDETEFPGRSAVLPRLGDAFRAVARIAPRAPHRADQAAQAAAIARRVIAGMGGRIHQKITSRLRIMAGSAARFIARCRSTSASPKTRRM